MSEMLGAMFAQTANNNANGNNTDADNNETTENNAENNANNEEKTPAIVKKTARDILESTLEESDHISFPDGWVFLLYFCVFQFLSDMI